MTNTPTLREGAIVQPDPSSTIAVRVLGSHVSQALGLQDQVRRAGWQVAEWQVAEFSATKARMLDDRVGIIADLTYEVAEFSATKARMLVRLVSPERFWVTPWNTNGVHVEIASIYTGVEEIDGRWRVAPRLGVIESTRWIARAGQVNNRRVS